MTDPQRPWLTRPDTIRLLWRWLYAVLALTVIAGLFVDLHPHFGIDGWFAFYAAFGFGTCVAMVVGAKLLGLFIKREDTYYEPASGEPGRDADG